MDMQSHPDVRQPLTGEPTSGQGALLQAVVDKARVLTGGQAAALCLLNPASSRIRLAAGSGSFTGRIGAEASTRRGLSGHVLASPSTIAVTCVSCDSACCPFATRAPHRHLVVPVRAGNTVRGVLCATSAASASVRHNRASVLAHLARLAGGCLQEADICSLAEGLGSLTARQRVAGDIHDGVAQRLVTLQMQLDGALGRLPRGVGSAPELLRVRDTLADTIQDVRTMIESLREPGEPTDAREAMAEVLSNTVPGLGSSGCLITTHVHHNFLVQREVAREVRQIITEAITNATRHADASTITVSLRRRGRQNVLTVTDDGRGFADSKVSAGASTAPDARRAHVGIEVMHLRAAVIGGRIEIRSAADKGTEVILRWPESPA